jgi:hypothetical protein
LNRGCRQTCSPGDSNKSSGDQAPVTFLEFVFGDWE